MSDTARLTTALEGRYHIERELGAGGMATVYLARDLKHDREVALKVLRPELGAVLGADRFLAEIKITAKLDHPHILTLIDSGAAEGFLYYVLPLVRGESLRDLLNREKQLGVDQALAITRQIASALDYAHQRGVVHRDIKPENILIHEGEAVLADFGIALAVKEAGGNRLTETGLSLGTPQYMSPEQATGDRQLDARSDVYSLGAVLYEMLAGEPPVTGPTAQAMIAKLITERPTRLRVVRDTVPEGIDTAVAKALSKVAADRFASAGEFGRALTGAASAPAAPAAAPAAAPTRARMLLVGAGVLVLVGALGVMLGRGRSHRGPSVVLRDRIQLTSNGRVSFPAISSDGKQLAYSARDCSRGTCRYSIELQDIGGSASRTLFNGATAVYLLVWSPDRRNLLMLGTVGGHYGSYLVSTLGGPPRLVTTGSAAFWGGDSLLLMDVPKPDSVHWVKVAGLDGVARDSIRVAGQATYAGVVMAVPESPWMLVGLSQAPRLDLLSLDRRGHEGGRWTMSSGNATIRAAHDALFAQLFQVGANPRPAIVRIPFDPASGRIAATQDTIYNGIVSQFDVTGDGSQLVLDEGTSEYSAWIVDLADAVRGALPPSRRVVTATTPMDITLARSGTRYLVERLAGSGLAAATVAAPGGTEQSVATSGSLLGTGWADSVTLMLAERQADGVHLSRMDARNGARRTAFVIRDSAVQDFATLGEDGWAWLPADGKAVMISQHGQAPRRIPLPDWYQIGFNLNGSRDGQHIAFVGWNAGTTDTMGLGMVSVADGKIERWTGQFGEFGSTRFLADGSVLLQIGRTRETQELLRVRGPGQVQSLGNIQRAVNSLSISDDLKRAGVTIKDYHGDAWMSRVVRP